MGSSVLSQAQALEDLVNKYWNPNTDPDTKGGIATEFAEGIYVLDSTINNSTDAIDNTTNQQIYSTNGGTPFRSVTLDATILRRRRSTYLLTPMYLVDVSNLQAITLGSTTQANELGIVQNEEAKAGSYLSKAVANSISLQSQYNITQNQVIQTQKYDNVINGVDDAAGGRRIIPTRSLRSR